MWVWPLQRHQIVFGLLILGFVILAARAFYVQVVWSDFLETEGNKRQVRALDVPAPRGHILDRHGSVLALSTPLASIWVDPKIFSQYPEAIRKLARELGQSEADLLQSINSNSNRRFLFIKRSILPQSAAQIESLGLPGVYAKAEYKRYYPSADTTAHLVGYTDIDDKGQDGIEYIYDGWLSGQAGRQQIIKDLEGRVVKFVKNIQVAEPGKDLILSIDKDLQYFAQRALKEARVKHQADSASLVILDAKTGEVLALVNEPGFNPNNRAQIKGEAIRNRAIATLIEPGSTIKPFILAKALEYELIKSDESINTSPGYINVQGHMISDAVNYGHLTAGEVIQKSSNVGIANVARRLKPEQQWELFRQLGFAQDLGLFLPGESMGYLRHHTEWMLVDQVSSSFGYGFNINLMQLAHAYTVFANEGRLLPLSLLKIDQVPESKQVVSPQAAKQVLAMLESVTHRGGTGTEARIEGYRVAGKTGTVHKTKAGQYQQNEYAAMFVGMVPASRPDMIMAVIVDKPSRGIYGGGSVAAPIFQEVMRHALRLRNVDPDGAL
ncbi:MAG: penicillin-binding protein 2 [Thiomicrospira sp.]|uniref:peptidoglycan D,D-transpeptidase FtsI family protein n=1 Tax=Thiomicrospira sp. TaxID=935 RepID=UPI0019DB72A4|nr:penicillin-binding protein 2 [Thiomicrospira sp.]MBE0493103.1 penicillin-binding protein 2 [Thiomicrospira sp.]